MVKEKETPTVCLDPRYPIAREYPHGDIHEQVTEPSITPSLYQMIQTSTVGSMQGNSAYAYPDLGDDDDQVHDHPDYEKLDKLDPVEKSNFVDQWLENPDLYEKAKDVSTETEPKDKADDKSAKKEPEPAEGD